MSERGGIDGRVSQALYTWAKSLINQTKGVGFCSISPSLVTDIDWLSRMKPGEFNLFTDNLTGAPELFAAREGFSEIGRMMRDGKAIIYCKTADGTVDELKRPQAVVHAIIANAELLGLSAITMIRPDFWIREVDGTRTSALNLDDRSLSELLIDERSSPTHSCPDGHGQAKAFLSQIAALDFADEGVIESLGSDVDLDAIFLAFPSEVADGFSLDPYVTVDGVRRELAIRLPADASVGRETKPEPGAGTECQLLAAVRRSAKLFLYGDEPNLTNYAKNVLDLCAQGKSGLVTVLPTVTESIERPVPDPVEVSEEPEPNPVLYHLGQVRDEARPLTEIENRALLSRLKSPGDAQHLLALPDPTLTDIFAKVADKNLVWDWSRLFKNIEANRFIILWNRTHVAAFLGVVLVKNLAYHDGKVRISSHQGLDPSITESVLRSMRSYDYGGRSIARIIKLGLGSDEAQRKFLARTFADAPGYLYDSILPHAEVSVTHMIDYIRFCFEPWAKYRRLPPNESTALDQILKPTMIHRLRLLLGR